jgi:hypothetical protein
VGAAVGERGGGAATKGARAEALSLSPWLSLSLPLARSSVAHLPFFVCAPRYECQRCVHVCVRVCVQEVEERLRRAEEEKRQVELEAAINEAKRGGWKPLSLVRPPRDADVVRKGRRASAIAQLYVTQKLRDYYDDLDRRKKAGPTAGGEAPPPPPPPIPVDPSLGPETLASPEAAAASATLTAAAYYGYDAAADPYAAYGQQQGYYDEQGNWHEQGGYGQGYGEGYASDGSDYGAGAWVWDDAYGWYWNPDPSAGAAAQGTGTDADAAAPVDADDAALATVQDNGEPLSFEEFMARKNERARRARQAILERRTRRKGSIVIREALKLSAAWKREVLAGTGIVARNDDDDEDDEDDEKPVTYLVEPTYYWCVPVVDVMLLVVCPPSVCVVLTLLCVWWRDRACRVRLAGSTRRRGSPCGRQTS